MTTPVIAALITASASLVLALGKIIWDEYEKKRERKLAASQQLDRFRAPLLAAVDDLGRRLNNIRNDGLFEYPETGGRRGMAIQSTLFRVAQYLAWTEIVYGFADRLRFQSDMSTRAVSKAMGDLAWSFASDEFDRKSTGDFTTSKLMLWREEQRAIGELMRKDDDEPGVIGFATFSRLYDEHFSQWFSGFASELAEPGSPESDRLAQLHRVTVRLMRELDVDRLLVQQDRSGCLQSPRWARSSALAPPTRHPDPQDRTYIGAVAPEDRT